MGIDWLKIKNEYISTKTSYRKLAEKYRIHKDTIAQRAKAENWLADRAETTAQIQTRTRQKTVEKVSAREADRIAHLLLIGDTLADKLERAVADLGELYTVKRKTSHVEKDKDDRPVAVEETAEIAVRGPSAINGANIRQLAATLKDLQSVAQAGGSPDDDMTPVIIDDVKEGAGGDANQAE